MRTHQGADFEQPGMRVLLLTHETSRTGAPRVALLVARILVDSGHDVRVVARAPGPLLTEFSAVAPTRLEPLHRVRRRLWRTPGLRPMAWVVDTALAFLSIAASRPDLVYVNSTAASIYLRPARWLGRRAILHTHESREVAGQLLTAVGAQAELTSCALIGCSESVRAGLALLARLPEDQVSLIPSVPDEQDLRQRSDDRTGLSYQPNELVVGCCGTVEPRKGADLWVEIAREVRSLRPDLSVRFVWVGEISDPPRDTAGVELVGPRANPYPHLRRFDVATLPSRDDPFPLVVLEAMLLGTPVVAFAVGSVAQQIGEAGVLITPGDVGSFAAALIDLLTDAEKRGRLGAAGRARAESLYSTRTFTAALTDVVARCSQ